MVITVATMNGGTAVERVQIWIAPRDMVGFRAQGPLLLVMAA
jgi:hypothetical protein